MGKCYLCQCEQRRQNEFDGKDRLESLRTSAAEVSCAECRRLKIKCDKQIPCQSCQRRGCATLCPNGSLSTGQGTRFVLAATEHLHRRIAKLTSRVRQLEGALAKLSPDPHPLLADDLTAEPDDDDPPPIHQSSHPAEVIDAFGTLSISDHGISRFFGPTGGSESLLLSHPDATNPHTDPATSGSHSLSELALFSQSFPFTPIGPPPDVHELIKSHLPPWNRAIALVDTYYEQVSWIFHGVVRSQLTEDTLPVLYNKQPPVPGEDYSSPHDLALVFMIFAMGALVQAEPSNAEAEHFHQLSRAALALQPILEKPSVVTIQTLHLMSIYNAMSGSDLKNDTSMEITWSLITLASHLSQTIGLHRDSARWGLSPKMVQRRRIIFWDLFVADVWQSLNTGRPPSFSLAYIDCSFPQYDKEISGFGSAFEVWQCRFAAECVADVTARTLTAEAPSYQTIMDLDCKVRDYPLPEGLSNAPKNDLGASFQRCVLEHIKETVLMYIHRSFFAQAIIDQPLNPLKSAYGPSFTAAYRAASTILRSVNQQFDLFPNSCSRFWTMWTFAFTAAVIFGTVVTRGPRSPLAQSAMAELEQALVLFTKASKYSIRALKSLPILTKLAEKARYALANVKASSVGDDWKLQAPGEDQDELAIFAGHTRFVSAKKAANEHGSGNGNDQVDKSRPIPSETAVQYPPPPPSQAQSQVQRQSTEYGWQHPQDSAQYDYDYVSSERTMQHQAPEVSSSLSSSAPLQGYSHWTNDPITLHPSTLPQVPQLQIPTQLHTPAHRYGHYGHRIPPDRMDGTAIDLHPSYYTPTTHTHRRTSLPPPLIPAHTSYHSHSYSQIAYNPPPQTSTATAAAAAAAPAPYSLSPYAQYPPLPHPQPPTDYGGTAELADLGLASRDSRLDERWSSFMADSGLLEGINFQSR